MQILVIKCEEMMLHVGLVTLRESVAEAAWRPWGCWRKSPLTGWSDRVFSDGNGLDPLRQAAQPHAHTGGELVRRTFLPSPG